MTYWNKVHALHKLNFLFTTLNNLNLNIEFASQVDFVRKLLPKREIIDGTVQ